MHLTNYAINKLSDSYIPSQNEDGNDNSHKRSLSQIWKDLIKSKKTKILKDMIENGIIIDNSQREKATTDAEQEVF